MSASDSPLPPPAVPMTYNGGMKTLEAKIPDKLHRAIDDLVAKGWFASRDALVREAISRFLDAHRPELMERFIRQDVEWGLRGRS
jgi:Arc/MetJ-type ribon-helix-helix transcriptional regulator